MGHFLENLWYEYQTESCPKPDKEEQKLLETLVSAEYELLAALTEEQKNTLQVLEDCLAELQSLSEKAAFIQGIRFASYYLPEVLFDR